VRIVAATNQDLQQKVRAREFREDLFYRLNVVPIQLPPLRERRDDIPLLAEYFIEKAHDELGTPAVGCTEEALALLRRYPWPGNVRELENTIQRAALLSPDQRLTPADFPSLLAEGQRCENNDSLEALIANKLHNALAQMDVNELDNLYDMVLHQMERPLIKIILDKTRGNQVRAAEILGINRNTLRKKIQTLDIDVKKD